MPSALSPRNHAEEFLRRMRVQCRRRLVEDRDARALHQHLGKPEALAHPARECRHPVPPDIGQADPRQRFVKPLVDLAPRQSGQPPRIGKVVAGRQPVVEADGIGEVADPALHFERVAQRVETGHFGASLGRFGQSEEHQDRRRLSRPVGPENADDLAGPDIEIDVIDSDRCAVALGELLRPNDGFFSHIVPPYPRPDPHPPRSRHPLPRCGRGAATDPAEKLLSRIAGEGGPSPLPFPPPQAGEG